MGCSTLMRLVMSQGLVTFQSGCCVVISEVCAGVTRHSSLCHYLHFTHTLLPTSKTHTTALLYYDILKPPTDRSSSVSRIGIGNWRVSGSSPRKVPSKESELRLKAARSLSSFDRKERLDVTVCGAVHRCDY